MGINAYTRLLLLLLLLFININAYTINTCAGLNKCTIIIVKSLITTNPHSHLNPPPPNEPLHGRAMPLSKRPHERKAQPLVHIIIINDI